MKLYYYYDQRGDVLYFSQGKPSKKDQSQEATGDVVIRLDPKTKRVRGFTILNFARRTRNRNMAIPLPIEVLLTPA